MTKADLARIKGGLGISLPQDYCDLMLTRADELKALTHEINGETCRWFDETLYLDADEVIITNLIERKPDAGTGYAFPNWWKKFFLVGSDGGGNYYCLRLDGRRGVWMIGSDCGDEAEKSYGSLAKFVKDELQRYQEEVGE